LRVPLESTKIGVVDGEFIESKTTRSKTITCELLDITDKSIVVEYKASDLHVAAGGPLVIQLDGDLRRLSIPNLS